MIRCSTQALIDRHFDGALAPKAERAMREHLPTCGTCDAYYERHRVLARLDPAALDPQERIARGLGLRRSRRVGAAISLGAIATLAAAAALVLSVRAGGGGSVGFTPRGNPGWTPGPSSHVIVYDVHPGAPPAVAGDAIGRHDELAFAYENGAAKRRLMVFGLDEHRHVYWFYPAWTAESENPVAIPIERGAGRRELPEAIRHDLHGTHLEIHALFLDRPVSVRELESLVQRQTEGPLPIPGAVESTLSFALVP